MNNKSSSSLRARRWRLLAVWVVFSFVFLELERAQHFKASSRFLPCRPAAWTPAVQLEPSSNIGWKIWWYFKNMNIYALLFKTRHLKPVGARHQLQVSIVYRLLCYRTSLIKPFKTKIWFKPTRLGYKESWLLHAVHVHSRCMHFIFFPNRKLVNPISWTSLCFSLETCVYFFCFITKLCTWIQVHSELKQRVTRLIKKITATLVVN